MTPRLLTGAVATALLTAAAARPWGLGALALVAHVPVFLTLLRAADARTGALLATVAALGMESVAYEAAGVLFPGASLVAALLAAAPYLAVGALAVRVRRSLQPRLGPAVASTLTLTALPSLWATAEWLPSRPELLGRYALPLGFVGYTQADLPTAALARYGSVTAVSHAVLLSSAALALGVLALRAGMPVLRERVARSPVTGRRQTAATVAPSRPARCLWQRLALAAALATLYPLAADASGHTVPPGALRGVDAAPVPGSPAEAVQGAGPATVPEGAGPLTVEVLQPHLPDPLYLAASRFPGYRAHMVAGMAALVTGTADLVVLPEAAWPGAVRSDALDAVVAEVGAAFGSGGAVLLGAPAVGFVPAGAPATGSTAARTTWTGPLGGGARTNSVFLHADGELRHVYAKRRVVPIGERGITAGRELGLVTVAGRTLAALVCYDALFPSDARAAALAGAHALVVVTDDAFAARSHVPELHLRAARFRAVETGLPVVFASNTGPSAVVDPAGRVTAHLGPGAAGSLVAALPERAGTTPYVVSGEWLGVANAALTGGLATALGRGGDRSNRRSARAHFREESEA